MTDLNDGEWHGWNGGKFPVHPKSLVEVCTRGSGVRVDRSARSASDWDWSLDGRYGDIIAFRVVTPYVEPVKPIECWMVYIGGARWATYPDLRTAEYDAERYNGAARVVHMREVRP